MIVTSIDQKMGVFTCDLELEIEFKSDDFKIADRQRPNLDDNDTYPIDLADEEELEVFFPRVALDNCQAGNEPTLRNVEVNFKTGNVFMQYNWIATFREMMELHRYPFDRQLCRAHIQVSDLVPVDTNSDAFEVSSHVSDFYYNGFHGIWCTARNKAFESECIVAAQVQRISEYYLWNVMLIIFFVVLLNITTLAIPVIEISGRMQISLALLLTLIAFNFSLTSIMPIKGYHSLHDWYFLLAFIFLALGSFAHMLLSSSGSLSLVEVFAPNGNEFVVDRVIQLSLSGVWVGVHILIICFCRFLRKPWEFVWMENHDNKSEALRNIHNFKHRKNPVLHFHATDTDYPLPSPYRRAFVTPECVVNTFYK